MSRGLDRATDTPSDPTAKEPSFIAPDSSPVTTRFGLAFSAVFGWSTAVIDPVNPMCDGPSGDGITANRPPCPASATYSLALAKESWRGLLSPETTTTGPDGCAEATPGQRAAAARHAPDAATSAAFA